uniref:RNA helicase n=1 Tax=Tetraselmis sp. GSL018 TaxID=582737 RepID=A0A061R2Y7_9CHLO|eukprot:CAMPEP_0177606382 /NCGR_PEP_ID=MMETSP0419_2-20121207/17276_1 /TAXON_ID=582737 /ORGANISM="Tetraselmis sp., Strain GSL018" /LENGTH=509 /DNA_ID=CAMNT_0019100737 /DNA_START=181 /DNA_END=1710 /DNA_ORIENTATION=+
MSSKWGDSPEDDKGELPALPEALQKAQESQGTEGEDNDKGDGPPPGFEGSGAPAANDSGAGKEGGGEAEAAGTDAPDKALNTLQESEETEVKTVINQDSVYSSAKTFEELPISKELRDGLYNEMKFERPSKIQATTLPMILTPPYEHLIAQAHNGSGKTTCFTLAMLSRIDPGVRAPQAICFCPTRELVIQNLMVLEKMGKYADVSCTSTATAEFDLQRESRTKIQDQVIIGTLGKLKSWANKRQLQFRDMRIMVFDEADEMLKADGFADDSIRMIRDIRKSSRDCQILLFSATFNERVKRFATKIVPSANQVFVPKEELSLDVIKQYRVDCPNEEAKTSLLKEMVFPNCENLGQTIIFVKTRERCKNLHSELTRDGYKVTAIHGDMLHEDRDRVVREFRNGTTKILIATDVLSRGFDVSQVTLVVNYDIPVERATREGQTPAYETYLHRIGRSGRFGRRGAAFNLTCGAMERRLLEKIASYFQHDIGPVPHDDEDKFLEVLEKAGLRN